MSQPPTPQQPHGSAPPMTAKEAKAHADLGIEPADVLTLGYGRPRGARAHAKALRPWYKKKRFILPLLLLVLIAAIVAGSGGDDPGTTKEQPGTAAKKAPAEKAPAEKAPAEKAPAKKAPAEKAPGIGTAVQSGDVSFTVTGFKCGVKSVGSPTFGAKAKGQFCFLRLTAENTGDEAAGVFGTNQKLLDDKGREFSADTEASLFVGKDGRNPLVDEINPGNSSKGTLVFDVPKNVDPVSAVLVGGFIGDEVTVNLS